MTRKIRWPSPEELFKLNLRSHDEFGQMQPLWFLEDLQRLQGIRQPKNPKPLPIVPLSDEDLRRLYPHPGPPWADKMADQEKAVRKAAAGKKRQRAARTKTKR